MARPRQSTVSHKTSTRTRLWDPRPSKLRLPLPHRIGLLLVFGDDCTRCWKQITGFGEEAQATASDVSNDALDFSMPNPMLEVSLEFPEGDLIQDDRGVRLARIEEGD